MKICQLLNLKAPEIIYQARGKTTLLIAQLQTFMEH